MTAARATDARPGADAVFLVGPTAAGKSEVAVELAAGIGGEIVSADSMQVYRGIDVLSAKPPAPLRARVPHHLLDVADPGENFDAARYERLAKAAVREIRGRGRIPVVTGGAGMYVRALADGIFAGAGRDAEARARLERIADADGNAALHARLGRIDPEAAGRIHPNDRKRIVRAIEVFEATGRPISSLQREWRAQGPAPAPGGAWESRNLGCRCVFLGMRRGRGDLARRIEARTAGMLAGGAVEEVRRLLSRCGRSRGTVGQSLGLEEVLAVIEGRCGEAEAAARIVRATRAYAKRQFTWFGRDERILWFDVAPDEPPADTARRMRMHLETLRRHAPPK